VTDPHKVTNMNLKNNGVIRKTKKNMQYRLLLDLVTRKQLLMQIANADMAKTLPDRTNGGGDVIFAVALYGHVPRR